MQTVVLEGELGNRFGRRWNTNCNTLLDIFKLIECQREGFRQYMMECNDAGIQFDIKRGDAYLEDESELLLKLNNDDVVVTPIPAGSKGAAGKLIAAIIIIYAGWAIAGAASTGATVAGGTGVVGGTTAGFGTAAGTVGMPTAGTAYAGANAAYMGGYALMMVGTSLGLRAISEMLAPNPADDSEEDVSLLGGTLNTTQQGVPVPIAYGELIVGGATISAGYTNYWNKFEVATAFLPGSSGATNVVVIPPGSVINNAAAGDTTVVDPTTSTEQGEL